MNWVVKKIPSLILIFTISTNAFICVAQDEKSKLALLTDSTDHRFDLSDFIIHANGFVPVPFLITEPALGGFGGGLALVFIKRRPPIIDTIRAMPRVRRIQPDLTGVGAMATVNDSWGGMFFRSGSWMDIDSKYKVLGGYVDMNLSFYGEAQDGSEKEHQLNIVTTPFFAALQKNIGHGAFSAGLSYLYLSTDVRLRSDDVPVFVQDKEWNSRVSMPGVVVEADNRDNIFTPDHGMKFHVSLNWSDNAVGSDYNFLRLNSFLYSYFQLADKVISGFRLEMSQVSEDTPFYLIPFINLRGVPTARYQGNISNVGEAELRWDMLARWSAVFFAGTGKVYDDWDEFNDSSWRSSAGGGFRYLIARKFKLRVGIDVARGPEDWAYYVVFGSAWLR